LCFFLLLQEAEKHSIFIHILENRIDCSTCRAPEDPASMGGKSKSNHEMWDVIKKESFEMDTVLSSTAVSRKPSLAGKSKQKPTRTQPSFDELGMLDFSGDLELLEYELDNGNAEENKLMNQKEEKADPLKESENTKKGSHSKNRKRKK